MRASYTTSFGLLPVSAVSTEFCGIWCWILDPLVFPNRKCYLYEEHWKNTEHRLSNEYKKQEWKKGRDMRNYLNIKHKHSNSQLLVETSSTHNFISHTWFLFGWSVGCGYQHSRTVIENQTASWRIFWYIFTEVHECKQFSWMSILCSASCYTIWSK